MVKHFMQKKYIGLFMLQLQMLLKHSEVVTEALKILSWKMEVAHWWNYVSPPKTFSPTERFHCIWKELVLELTLQHSPRPSSTQRHVHGSSPSAICSLPCSASSLCQCLSAVWWPNWVNASGSFVRVPWFSCLLGGARPFVGQVGQGTRQEAGRRTCFLEERWFTTCTAKQSKIVLFAGCHWCINCSMVRAVKCCAAVRKRQ